MTKKQQQEIIEVIKKDATIQYSYVGNNPGEACVIGGLALASGVQHMLLQGFRSEILEDGTHCIIDPISKKFGLSFDQLARLQEINDQVNNLKQRRATLVNAVKTFPTTD